MTDFLLNMARDNRETFIESVKDMVREFTNFQEGYVVVPTKTGRFEKIVIGEDELKRLDKLTYLWNIVEDQILDANNGDTENNPFRINGRNIFAMVKGSDNNYRMVIGSLGCEGVVRSASNKEVLVYLLENMEKGED